MGACLYCGYELGEERRCPECGRLRGERFALAWMRQRFQRALWMRAFVIVATAAGYWAAFRFELRRWGPGILLLTSLAGFGLIAWMTHARLREEGARRTLPMAFVFGVLGLLAAVLLASQALFWLK